MRFKLITGGAVALGGIAFMMAPVASSASADDHGIPHYQHIIEIMMENTSFSTIIGNPLARRSTRWPTSTAWPLITSG